MSFVTLGQNLFVWVANLFPSQPAAGDGIRKPAAEPMEL